MLKWAPRIILKKISLSEWLTLLEARHPRAIDLGLDRISQVAERLDLLVPARQVISVAGTNGKGSCVALLEAMLLTDESLGADENKVGAFTSPHLSTYNERIRINAKPVDDQLICAAFAEIEVARCDISLTYFEFGTLAALWVFKQQAVDIALLEVGLGGRLDAVNIVNADVAVVTSIDLDHQDWLGNDRESIGVEKVGIARRGRPLVCGDIDPPRSLLAYLKGINAQSFMLGTEAFCCSDELCSEEVRSQDAQTLDLVCTDTNDQIVNYRGLPRPQLPRDSALCAVQALVCLGRAPSQETVGRAFTETSLPGRFQQAHFGHHPVILDVAHNPAAACLLAEKLDEYLKTTNTNKVYGLFGALADKDIDGMISPLLSDIDSWHVCELEAAARAASAKDIAAKLEAFNLSPHIYGSVEKGWLSVVEQMSDNDVLVVFGSFYMVSEGLQLLDG